MACFTRKFIFKKFLCCCDTSPEHVCCIIGCLCLFVSFNHFCNFIPFFCLLTAVPHCLVMIIMALAGGLLIAGVTYDKPVLLVLFPWIMVACILLQIVYAILLYVSNRCLTSMLVLLFSGHGAKCTGIVIGYTLIGSLAGIDFIFSLYSLLLISCTVTEIVLEPHRNETDRRLRVQNKRSRETNTEEDLEGRRCSSYDRY